MSANNLGRHHLICLISLIGLSSSVLPAIVPSPRNTTVTRKTSVAIEPDFVLPHRACYFASWARYRPPPGKFLPGDVDPELCTMLLYAFGQITNNEVNTYDWKDEDNFRELSKMKQKFPKFKVILSVGGWTLKEQFPPMAASSDNRNTFVASCVAKLRQWGLDGIDIDWEYPTTDEKEDFAALITELRAAFDAESRQTGNVRLILGAAVGSVHTEGYNITVMAKTMDFINVMTYDFHGATWEPTQTQHNSPLYPSSSDPLQYSISASMKAWSTLGMPKAKLNVGLAFYGRDWRLTDPNKHGLGAPANGPSAAGPLTREAGILGYNEICTAVQGGQLKRVMDEEIVAPYAYGDTTWVGYDDEESIRRKAKWIVSNSFAGAFVWEISNDDFAGGCGTPKILLKTLREVLKRQSDKDSASASRTTTRSTVSTRKATIRPSVSHTVSTVVKTSSTTPKTTTTGNHVETGLIVCDWRFCTSKINPGSYSLGKCRDSYCDCGHGFYAHARQCPTSLIYDELAGVCNWRTAVKPCRKQK